METVPQLVPHPMQAQRAPILMRVPGTCFSYCFFRWLVPVRVTAIRP
jgi:hypothetical protein